MRLMPRAAASGRMGAVPAPLYQMRSVRLFSRIASAVGQGDVAWIIRSAVSERNHVVKRRWVGIGEPLPADVALLLLGDHKVRLDAAEHALEM
jgi:hypothetical protein